MNPDNNEWHQTAATWVDGIQLAPFSWKECAHSARFATQTAILLWQAGFHHGTGHDVLRIIPKHDTKFGNIHTITEKSDTIELYIRNHFGNRQAIISLKPWTWLLLPQIIWNIYSSGNLEVNHAVLLGELLKGVGSLTSFWQWIHITFHVWFALSVQQCVYPLVSSNTAGWKKIRRTEWRLLVGKINDSYGPFSNTKHVWWHKGGFFMLDKSSISSGVHGFNVINFVIPLEDQLWVSTKLGV